MNVLFLTTHLNAGGITSYLLTVTKGLVKRGHRVFIVSSGGKLEKELGGYGATVIRLDIKTKSELSPKIYAALFPLMKIVKENKIDVIHAHTRVTQVMATLLSRLSGRAAVSTTHGFFKPKLFRRIFSCWGKRAIAISPAVAKHLEEDLRFPSEKIVLVESGIDIDKFTSVSNEARMAKKKELGLSSTIVIGNIARLSDVKGPDILIEAFAQVISQHSNVRLLLVGEGKMKSALEQKIKELNLGGAVTIRPVVNQTADMLSVFDIFVMPSRQEGLGLSVMEAQASALAVVASRVGGLPGLIKDGETGVLVKPQDVQDLAKGILRLLDNPQLMAQVAENAYAYARQSYSAEPMIDKIIEVYQNVTAHQKP